MKAGRITAALALLTLATCHTIANTGLRYNRSPSVPTGWYWINHSNRTPKVGDYVAFCLPTSAIQREATRRGYLGRGPCPGNASALLKIVVAGPGDAVEVRGTGVLINDLPWPNSAPVSAAIQRKAVTGHVPIEPGQYFLMSENDPLGFDGRYFGPMPATLVLGTAHPLASTMASINPLGLPGGDLPRPPR